MSLRDRLNRARHARFIGREEELALFQDALSAEELPFHVLHVHGPGGVGKTTLLGAFRRLCEEAGVPALRLDGRDVEPTPTAFERAAGDLGLTPEPAAGGDGAAPLPSGRRVLLVDNYEALVGLDEWVREAFLPEQDEDLLVVLAGRYRPRPAWRTDLGWQAEVVTVPLRNFSPDETAAFLAATGVPPEHRRAVLGFTHGHPMALSLVAERARQEPERAGEAAGSPDVVRTLLERFVQEVPTRDHRAAVDAAAIARSLDEPLLSALLDLDDARALFDWLRGLSFIEEGERGLVLHDLAREVLAADLRWRDAERYAELHARARAYYTAHLQEPRDEAERRDVLAAYVFLYRDNPVVRPLFDRLRAEWRAAGKQTADVFHADDAAALRAMVARHEGDEAAELAAHWFREDPAGVEVYRDATGTPSGFLLALLLEGAPAGADPAVEAAWAFLRAAAPLREGERALLFRFWMDAEHYQGVSATQSLVFARTVRHYLATPRLAYSFIPCADPDFWAGVFGFAGLRRLPDADFEVGGRRYGVYGHDWRTEPPEAWLDQLAQRIPHAAPAALPAPAQQPLIVLSEPDFAEAVKEALRHYKRPHRMAGHPLLRSRLVVDAAGEDADEPARIEALRALLATAAEAMRDAPREEPYFRALRATYLHPAATQALAAERLGLPFSTYRRHLKRGIDHVVEVLWRQETAA
ncbi:MAG: hypothetical protein R3362_05825 [Rhodothermales bacterium]|nr:hypothetical protein [Rhodothermales bacterium]